MKRHYAKKAWSGILVFFMILSPAVDPAMAGTVRIMPFSAPEGQAPLRLDLSAELGVIQAHAAGEGPLLVHIQTAHGHGGVQRRIENLLAELYQKHEIKTVFIEGSASELETGWINYFPDDPARTRNIIEDLTDRSLIRGAERFLLSHPDARGLGIETLPLYRRNREAFVKVKSAQERAEKFLRGFEIQLVRLKAAWLEPELRALMNEFDQFEQGITPLSTWLFRLCQEAERVLGLDQGNPVWQVEWPMLVRYAQITELAETLDRDVFRRQRESFLRVVKHFLAPGLLQQVTEILYDRIQGRSLPDPETGLFLEQFVTRLPADFPYEKYPQVFQQLGLRVLQSELHGHRLFSEADRLRLQLMNAMTGTSEEKDLLAAIERSRLLMRLLHLELTPEDYETIRTDEGHRPSRLIRRLQTLNREGRVKDFRFAGGRELERLYEAGLDFYRLARERDRAMTGRIEAQMIREQINKAVVITGGFHAAPFEQFFRKNNFHYALVMPHMENVSGKGKKAYENAMLQDAAPLFRGSMLEGATLAASWAERVRHGMNPYWTLQQEAAAIVGSAGRDDRAEGAVFQGLNPAYLSQGSLQWQDEGISVSLSAGDVFVHGLDAFVPFQVEQVRAEENSEVLTERLKLDWQHAKLRTTADSVAQQAQERPVPGQVVVDQPDRRQQKRSEAGQIARNRQGSGEAVLAHQTQGRFELRTAQDQEDAEPETFTTPHDALRFLLETESDQSFVDRLTTLRGQVRILNRNGNRVTGSQFRGFFHVANALDIFFEALPDLSRELSNVRRYLPIPVSNEMTEAEVLRSMIAYGKPEPLGWGTLSKLLRLAYDDYDLLASQSVERMAGALDRFHETVFSLQLLDAAILFEQFPELPEDSSAPDALRALLNSDSLSLRVETNDGDFTWTHVAQVAVIARPDYEVLDTEPFFRLALALDHFFGAWQSEHRLNELQSFFPDPASFDEAKPLTRQSLLAAMIENGKPAGVTWSEMAGLAAVAYPDYRTIADRILAHMGTAADRLIDAHPDDEVNIATIAELIPPAPEYIDPFRATLALLRHGKPVDVSWLDFAYMAALADGQFASLLDNQKFPRTVHIMDKLGETPKRSHRNGELYIHHFHDVIKRIVQEGYFDELEDEPATLTGLVTFLLEEVLEDRVPKMRQGGGPPRFWPGTSVRLTGLAPATYIDYLPTMAATVLPRWVEEHNEGPREELRPNADALGQQAQEQRVPGQAVVDQPDRRQQKRFEAGQIARNRQGSGETVLAHQTQGRFELRSFITPESMLRHLIENPDEGSFVERFNQLTAAGRIRKPDGSSTKARDRTRFRFAVIALDQLVSAEGIENFSMKDLSNYFPVVTPEDLSEESALRALFWGGKPEGMRWDQMVDLLGLIDERYLQVMTEGLRRKAGALDSFFSKFEEPSTSPVVWRAMFPDSIHTRDKNAALRSMLEYGKPAHVSWTEMAVLVPILDATYEQVLGQVFLRKANALDHFMEGAGLDFLSADSLETVFVADPEVLTLETALDSLFRSGKPEGVTWLNMAQLAPIAYPGYANIKRETFERSAAAMDRLNRTLRNPDSKNVVEAGNYIENFRYRDGSFQTWQRSLAEIGDDYFESLEDEAPTLEGLALFFFSVAVADGLPKKTGGPRRIHPITRDITRGLSPAVFLNYLPVISKRLFPRWIQNYEQEGRLPSAGQTREELRASLEEAYQQLTTTSFRRDRSRPGLASMEVEYASEQFGEILPRALLSYIEALDLIRMSLEDEYFKPMVLGRTLRPFWSPLREFFDEETKVIEDEKRFLSYFFKLPDEAFLEMVRHYDESTREARQMDNYEDPADDQVRRIKLQRRYIAEHVQELISADPELGAAFARRAIALGNHPRVYMSRFVKVILSADQRHYWRDVYLPEFGVARIQREAYLPVQLENNDVIEIESLLESNNDRDKLLALSAFRRAFLSSGSFQRGVEKVPRQIAEDSRRLEALLSALELLARNEANPFVVREAIRIYDLIDNFSGDQRDAELRRVIRRFATGELEDRYHMASFLIPRAHERKLLRSFLAEGMRLWRRQPGVFLRGAGRVAHDIQRGTEFRAHESIDTDYSELMMVDFDIFEHVFGDHDGQAPRDELRNDREELYRSMTELVYQRWGTDHPLIPINDVLASWEQNYAEILPSSVVNFLEGLESLRPHLIDESSVPILAARALRPFLDDLLEFFKPQPGDPEATPLGPAARVLQTETDFLIWLTRFGDETFLETLLYHDRLTADDPSGRRPRDPAEGQLARIREQRREIWAHYRRLLTDNPYVQERTGQRIVGSLYQAGIDTGRHPQVYRSPFVNSFLDQAVSMVIWPPGDFRHRPASLEPLPAEIPVDEQDIAVLTGLREERDPWLRFLRLGAFTRSFQRQLRGEPGTESARRIRPLSGSLGTLFSAVKTTVREEANLFVLQRALKVFDLFADIPREDRDRELQQALEQHLSGSIEERYHRAAFLIPFTLDRAVLRDFLQNAYRVWQQRPQLFADRYEETIASLISGALPSAMDFPVFEDYSELTEADLELARLVLGGGPRDELRSAGENWEGSDADIAAEYIRSIQDSIRSQPIETRPISPHREHAYTLGEEIVEEFGATLMVDPRRAQSFDFNHLNGGGRRDHGLQGNAHRVRVARLPIRNGRELEVFDIPIIPEQNVPLRNGFHIYRIEGNYVGYSLYILDQTKGLNVVSMGPHIFREYRGRASMTPLSPDEIYEISHRILDHDARGIEDFNVVKGDPDQKLGHIYSRQGDPVVTARFMLRRGYRPADQRELSDRLIAQIARGGRVADEDIETLLLESKSYFWTLSMPPYTARQELREGTVAEILPEPVRLATQRVRRRVIPFRQHAVYTPLSLTRAVSSLLDGEKVYAPSQGIVKVQPVSEVVATLGTDQARLSSDYRDQTATDAREAGGQVLLDEPLFARLLENPRALFDLLLSVRDADEKTAPILFALTKDRYQIRDISQSLLHADSGLTPLEKSMARAFDDSFLKRTLRLIEIEGPEIAGINTYIQDQNFGVATLTGREYEEILPGANLVLDVEAIPAADSHGIVALILGLRKAASLVRDVPNAVVRHARIREALPDLFPGLGFDGANGRSFQVNRFGKFVQTLLSQGIIETSA